MGAIAAFFEFTTKMKYILFSDIDGCFILPHQTPDFHRLRAQFLHLQQLKVDIILNTSKTAHEVMALNQQLALPGPFIVENGGGLLYKSNHSFSMSGKEQLVIRSFGEYQLLSLVAEELRVPVHSNLLTQMTAQYLHELIGLPLEEAALAKIRFFTAPIYIGEQTNEQKKALQHELQAHSFPFVATKNFFHVCCSPLQQKGQAIQTVLSLCYPNIACTTFAIGDSANDFSMFDVCTHAFYIHPNATSDSYPCYSHWNEAMMALFAMIKARN